MSKMNLNELRDKAYKTACEHGFHDQELSNNHFLCLVISELMEAVEADRKGRRANVDRYNKKIANSRICQGLDSDIRLLDLAGLRGINLELANGDIDDCIEDMAEACKDETFTESIYSISTLPVRYDGIFDFSTAVNDMILSIFGLAKHLDVDLFWHIEQKMKYNELREKMHGKKY